MDELSKVQPSLLDSATIICKDADQVETPVNAAG
jgi:hypothetical protein